MTGVLEKSFDIHIFDEGMKEGNVMNKKTIKYLTVALGC